MAKKKTRRRTSKKKARRGRPRRANLESLSYADLQAELERRESYVQELHERREALLEELGAVEAELENTGAPAGPARKRRGRRPGRPVGSGARQGRRGRRPRNKTNLADALSTVLRGKTMSVTEVADAVQAAGYKTKSANFRTIVNQALLSNPQKFKKVARGQYTAK